MNIRLYNARILTMEKDRDIFFGEIWIKNDKIAFIEQQSQIDMHMSVPDLPRINWDVQIDCEGNLLMPGFKNCHTHSGMTFLRSYADDMPLAKWLNEKVFPAEAKLTPYDIYPFVKLAILEYLTAGITSIFDMYIATEATAKACMDMGMRCVLVSGLNNFTSSIEKLEQEYLDYNRRSPLLTYQMGCHAEYTCSKELLQKLSELVHRYEVSVYLHLAETQQEVKECRERYGMTPAAFLDSLGLFDFGGGGYHCVHMTDEDMEVFERRGLSVITNPASNAKLASGMAPVAEYVKRKIPVAIGTDGPASNNCLDMFREMFLVAGLSNLREMDATSVDAMEILRMATVNGSKVMNLPDTDILAKGKKADIIMIDLHQPNMQPIHNIAKNIVYSGSKSNIKMTMINGKILYKDGQFNIGEKPEDIYKACQETLEKLDL
ncbi:MAG: amidohydrolase [Lachnospiraceae bacterium]|nr:amidohydrolase [Lachnospiraceae bacterium]